MENFYNKSQLKELGFNERLISDLLPQPKLVPNPFYRKAAPMQLWEKEVVDPIMQSEDFLKEKEKSKKRKSAAAKSVKTKQDKLMLAIEQKILHIFVKRIDWDELYNRTLISKQNFKYECGQYDFDAYSADFLTIERWMVNFVRHELTCYDEEIFLLSGKVGKHKAYCKYKNAVLSEIARVYPKLSKECQRQMLSDTAWPTLQDTENLEQKGADC